MKPAFQEPLTEQRSTKQVSRKVTSPPVKATTPAKATVSAPTLPTLEPGRPTEHNGIAIVSERLRSNLPSGAPFKISTLQLEDGTQAYACRDCQATGDTVTELRHHRNDVHGARYGKQPPKVVWDKSQDLNDFVLPPRGDKPAPTNPMEMTLAEFLSLAPSYAAMADLIDRLEKERDAALAKIAEIQNTVAEAKHALAVYPSLQEEVVDLRLRVRNVGSFDEMKQELQALRAWKKKMTQRLQSVGFSLTDDDGKE
jgi:hypothetical protein